MPATTWASSAPASSTPTAADVDDDYHPDWHCVLCGSSGMYADGPAECDCADGTPRS
ncbi:hypothetical protein GCM10017750_58900 [Streptomyces racemochromogenes]